MEGTQAHQLFLLSSLVKTEQILQDKLRRVHEQLKLLQTTMKQELIVLSNSPCVDEKKTSRANSPSRLETETNLHHQMPSKNEEHLDKLLHEGDLKCKDAKGGSWKKAHVTILVGCIKYKKLFQSKYVEIPFEDIIKICGTWTELEIIEEKRVHIFRACKSTDSLFPWLSKLVARLRVLWQHSISDEHLLRGNFISDLPHSEFWSFSRPEQRQPRVKNPRTASPVNVQNETNFSPIKPAKPPALPSPASTSVPISGLVTPIKLSRKTARPSPPHSSQNIIASIQFSPRPPPPTPPPSAEEIVATSPSGFLCPHCIKRLESQAELISHVSVCGSRRRGHTRSRSEPPAPSDWVLNKSPNLKAKPDIPRKSSITKVITAMRLRAKAQSIQKHAITVEAAKGNEDVMKEGQLQKKGLHLKWWVTRYVLLTRTRLLYFRPSKDDTKTVHTANIDNVTPLMPDGDFFSFTFRELASATSNLRMHEFRGKNRTYMQDWHLKICVTARGSKKDSAGNLSADSYGASQPLNTASQLEPLPEAPLALTATAQRHTRQGIPCTDRDSLFWKLTSAEAWKKSQNETRTLLQLLQTKLVKDEIDDWIRRDLNRTYPRLPLLEHGPDHPLGVYQRHLYAILRAYAVLDTEVGYCQGLNWVAALLLFGNLEPEALTMTPQEAISPSPPHSPTTPTLAGDDVSAEQTKPETLNGDMNDDEDGVGTGSDDEEPTITNITNSSPSSQSSCDEQHRLPVIMEHVDSTASVTEPFLSKDDAQPGSVAIAELDAGVGEGGHGAVSKRRFQSFDAEKFYEAEKKFPRRRSETVAAPIALVQSESTSIPKYDDSQLPRLEKVLWVLSALMHKPHYDLRRSFTPHMPHLELLMLHTQRYVEQLLPQLSAYLEERKQSTLPEDLLTTKLYAFDWLMTLFARLHLPLGLRVLDAFLYLGWDIVIRVTVAILKTLQGTLLKMEFAQILHFLSDELPLLLERGRIPVDLIMDVAHSLPSLHSSQTMQI